MYNPIFIGYKLFDFLQLKFPLGTTKIIIIIEAYNVSYPI